MGIESKNHRESPVRGTTHSQGSREDARLPLDTLAERGEKLLDSLKEERESLVQEKNEIQNQLAELNAAHKERNRKISLGGYPRNVFMAYEKSMKEKERYFEKRRPLSKRVQEIEAALAELKPRLVRHRDLQEGRTQEQKKEAFQSVSSRLRCLERKVDEILEILRGK